MIAGTRRANVGAKLELERYAARSRHDPIDALERRCEALEAALYTLASKLADRAEAA